MTSTEVLHPAVAVPCAWQPRATRPVLEALFALDAHLGRFVSQAREEMLAQIRLAWWRERLGEPVDRRPRGDPVLAAVGEHWAGREEALVALVDGWEAILGAAPLSNEAIAAFAAGRGQALVGFAALVSPGREEEMQAARIGRRWALADLAFRTSEEAERQAALSMAEDIEPCGSLPASMRGLAVLGALADRSLARKESLFTGRIAPLVALRVGMTGR